MADSPPAEVLIEFLRVLDETIVDFEERLVPVLRGSLLLRHWFGERARPAADIDLECFERPPLEPNSGEETPYRGDGFGAWGEFQSLVDFGKAMCRYAAESTAYHEWRHRGGAQSSAPPEVVFHAMDEAGDGHSLWTYGTPGERYFAGWVWRRGQTGRVQIDIAQPGDYRLDEIDVAEVELVSPGGISFRHPAYTRETLLAAKISWLLRSLTWRSTEHGAVALHWSGEPKDLFDVHLLLTSEELDATAFQKSLLAVGAADDLDWDSLEIFFDPRRTAMADEDFSNWGEFRRRHAALVSCGPAKMLETIADRLEPLLGDFYIPEESPFLYAIHADPVDEFAYSVYADWLEERGDPRCEFLRSFTAYYFHEDEQSPQDFARTCSTLRDLLGTTSQPWLHRLFGVSERFRDIRNCIERRASTLG